VEEARKRFLGMRLIHAALATGLIMFGLVVLILYGKEMSVTPCLRNPVTLVALFLCLSTLSVASTVHLFYRKVGPAPAAVGAALQKYQTFCLVRWSVIEGGALFSAVAALVTRNVLPFGLFVVSVAVLLYLYPSRKEFLSLSSQGAGR